MIFTAVVLVVMFAILITDRVGADSVMLMALTAFIASGILTMEEGLEGFSNEGLLTVLILFVVADGISKTGALDWYMGKILGRPKTAASAQFRMMVPITLVSAFLNNTPVVAVMIPIVQKWAKNNNIPIQQLLMHVSFASIFGGTCTLIGTSTNLVVVGLLEDRYPGDDEVSVGLFDLGLYGVPVAIAGIAYMIFASPLLLPGGNRQRDSDSGDVPLDNQEDILLGARLAPWSPAAGRSVKRSGLRDTGGIYLVSVYRATTGNIHRAVGQEFVLNVGDILYFTGLIEGFGEFCEEHGLELLTNEIDDIKNTSDKLLANATMKTSEEEVEKLEPLKIQSFNLSKTQLLPVFEGEDRDGDFIVPAEIGVTKESLLNADDAERSRAITRMIDMIRKVERDEPVMEKKENYAPLATHKVVVMTEHDLVVIGIDARDRPGLLLDVSKGLSSLRLNLRHTEASVVGQRSISVWRCESVETALPDLDEIWSVLNALLEVESGSQAVKTRGLRVLRAVVTKTSALLGKTPFDVDFRGMYRAAIVAVQKGGKNVAISTVVFGPGDILVLQVAEDSPLLKVPPTDFYKRLSESQEGGRVSRTNSFVNMLTKSLSGKNTDNLAGMHVRRQSDGLDEELANRNSIGHNHDTSKLDDETGFVIAIASNEDEGIETRENMVISQANEMGIEEVVWKDLHVMFLKKGDTTSDGSGAREFLTAMEVAPKSKLAKSSVAEIGLDKLPGVFLVSIDRPSRQRRRDDKKEKPKVTVITSPTKRSNSDLAPDDRSDIASLQTVDQVFTALTPDTPLEEGDVLWFAGSASAVGDLRKIPGLMLYESDEVEKINEKVHDRRLVEAVIGRRGPLVGKTVKEVQFRTKFGAAVIAVHRDGKRIHEHPGKIKLQAGDVLLLEAGPTFIKRGVDNNRSFALLAEVEDSAPPRLTLLIPALLLTVTMLAVYTAGVASLLTCALIASMLMVCIGILSEQEARDAVNWEIYIAIASAFGIGEAMVNSGLAEVIANFLVDVGGGVGLGDAGLLGAVYLGTFLISLIVTNNAAAALMFPIALDAAEKTDTDRTIMCFALMLGASASFASPFGYQTNLMVYGPGGYKTKDFLAIGSPLQIVLWVLSVCVLAGKPENWWISWIGTSVALFLVVATRVMDPSSWCQQKTKDA